MNDLPETPAAGACRRPDLNDALPFYAAGTLNPAQRKQIDEHLAACPACQQDLRLWRAAGQEIRQADRALHPAGAPGPAAYVHLAQQALQTQAASRPASLLGLLRQTVRLIHAQIPLVRRELWPASAAVMGIGWALAAFSANSGLVYALAPLLAAASLAAIYGPENDPGMELALSTPTLPRQVLLARMALVFGYDLLLALVASLGLLPWISPAGLLALVGSWLGPMAFLSAAALVLSLRIGPGNAVFVTYLAWLGQLLARQSLAAPESLANLWPQTWERTLPLLSSYVAFWQSPAALLGLAALLIGLSAWLVGRPDHALPQMAG